MTKDSIDRLNAQRDEVIPLARGTRDNVRSPTPVPVEVANGSSAQVVKLVRRTSKPPVPEWPASEPPIEIEVAPLDPPASESKQTSTIQGMPPIDKAPAKPAPRHRDPGDSSALVYALIALVIASAMFALWAMTR